MKTLDLFMFADGAKYQLSTYVAANLKRVMTLAPGDLYDGHIFSDLKDSCGFTDDENEWFDYP